MLTRCPSIALRLVAQDGDNNGERTHSGNPNCPNIGRRKHFRAAGKCPEEMPIWRLAVANDSRGDNDISIKARVQKRLQVFASLTHLKDNRQVGEVRAYERLAGHR